MHYLGLYERLCQLEILRENFKNNESNPIISYIISVINKKCVSNFFTNIIYKNFFKPYLQYSFLMIRRSPQ